MGSGGAGELGVIHRGHWDSERGNRGAGEPERTEGGEDRRRRRDVFVSLPKAGVIIPGGIASIKTLPKLELWSLSLAGIIVEAMPTGIASDCFAPQCLPTT